MQTITTKLIPATNTKPTRMKAVTTSGLSLTVSRDNFDSMKDAHRGTAYALMLKLKWTGVIIGGDTKQGMVWVFFNNDAPMISSNAEQIVVNIHTGNAAFSGSLQELKRIFTVLADMADLEDLHNNRLYDFNGNTCGFVKVLSCFDCSQLLYLWAELRS